ncbi:MAG: outer membrane protein assembly factor BamA [Pseudomonadota bacterium]|nr:outer membrane protein assembly factor BamA [Pseudomonadota bacterium]
MNLSRLSGARAALWGLIVALVVALGVLATSESAYAQVSPVASKIVVNGASRGDADSIKSYFSGTDQASVNRAVSDLTATGMFTRVSAQIVGDKVVVNVVEGSQIINRVAFEHNSKLKGDQLGVEVQSKSYSAFNKTVADADIGRIKEAYKKIGRNDVNVTYRLVNLPNGRVDLVFNVDEGDKTGIKSIVFIGNNNISNWRLKSLMQSTEMNLLSFFKTSDVYNPDTLASDEESIRKYYMRYGYADFRITNTAVVYDPAQKGYIVTISMEEGPQYHVSGVSVTSRLAKVSGDELAHFVTQHPGDVYNATAVDKTVEAMTRELARRGYAFSDVRPHGERDNVNHTIALAFTVDDAPKVYVERIDIVGNTRTRDYVIRREFDIGEGDPYNHALVERGERRLTNLDFFKSVHVSTRPGSAQDRIIITVAVEDKPTGSVSLSGGYSTLDGPLAEVAFTEANFLGRGQYLRLSVSRGQFANGWGITFTEPYLFDQRLAGGFDLYHKQQLQNLFALYETDTTGINLRLGVPITEELTFQPNYSLYASQITIPNNGGQPYNDCSTSTGSGNNWSWTPGGTSVPQTTSPMYNCLINGEASAAIKEAAAQGQVITSLIGYSLIWDSLDNRRNPSQGALANFHQDIAGLGGASHFVRETIDGRYYYPVTDDLITFVRLQGGRIDQIGRGDLPIIDNFNLGPSLVRGFAPGGLGPRDISDPNNIAANSLGGTTYFGGTAEIQFPIFGLPRELGLKGALFVDAGTLTGFQGRTDFSSMLGYNFCPSQNVGKLAVDPKTKIAYLPTQPSCLTLDDEKTIRTSLGASLLWASPLGPIRIDFAYPVIKGRFDQVQYINFSGGATF